jgi:hypothetical protein
LTAAWHDQELRYVPGYQVFTHCMLQCCSQDRAHLFDGCGRQAGIGFGQNEGPYIRWSRARQPLVF